MHRETSEWTIRMLVDFRHRINVDAEYQRAPVWSKAQKALLIDSILRDFDIPKIILRKQPEGSQFLFDVIDGKQRLTAIWEFFSGAFTIQKSAEDYPRLGNLRGKHWTDLSVQAKDKLQFANITVSRIAEVEDDEIRELFLRLQRGEPLNAAEKRNAMKGPVRDFVTDQLAKHSFWGLTGIRTARFGREEHAAILLLLVSKNGPASLKSADLSELYEDCNFDPNGTEAQTTLRLLDMLNEVASFDKGFIRTRWGLVDLSISLLRLERKGRDLPYADVMRFFRNFEQTRRDVSAFLSDLQTNLVYEIRTTEDLRSISELSTLPKDMLSYHMAFAREGASEQNVKARADIMYRRIDKFLLSRD